MKADLLLDSQMDSKPLILNTKSMSPSREMARAKVSFPKFDSVNIEFTPTPNTLKGNSAKEFMKRITGTDFLRRVSARSISSMIPESTIAIETRSGFQLIIHPNGATHIRAENVSVRSILVAERQLRTIAKEVNDSKGKDVKFDVYFASHSDLDNPRAKQATSNIVRRL